MSQKISSKNLSYSSTLPPFLAALHAQAAGASPGPDPLAPGQRRSAKKRSSSQEAEDAPLVVDEHGNAVHIRVNREGAVVEDPPAEGEDSPPGGGAAPEPKSAFGGRKRKVGRVVGSDGDVSDGASYKNAREPVEKEGQQSEPPSGKKAGKKAKKIKLSFDQDEEG